MMKPNEIISGKRKTAVAKATISDGNGKFTVNKKPLHLFNNFQSLTLREPIILAGNAASSVNILGSKPPTFLTKS